MVMRLIMMTVMMITLAMVRMTMTVMMITLAMMMITKAMMRIVFHWARFCSLTWPTRASAPDTLHNTHLCSSSSSLLSSLPLSPWLSWSPGPGAGAGGCQGGWRCRPGTGATSRPVAVAVFIMGLLKYEVLNRLYHILLCLKLEAYLSYFWSHCSESLRSRLWCTWSNIYDEASDNGAIWVPQTTDFQSAL